MNYSLIDELAKVFTELLSETSEYLEREYDKDVATEYKEKWNNVLDKYEESEDYLWIKK